LQLPVSPQKPLLSVSGLTIEFPSSRGWTRVVDDLSFSLNGSKTLGIVGESGSGKSVTALAIAGLIGARGGRLAAGSIQFRDHDITRLTEAKLRALRGRHIGMIFQQPTRCLNPAFTIGHQIAETLTTNLGTSRKAALAHAVSLLDRVGIARAAERIHEYPHQFSGGMCQRVMIAIALSCNPSLLIADEPTTALDMTVQAKILDLLIDLQRETYVAIILISHDIGVVAEFCERTLVMHAGQAVECGPTEQLLLAPRHPYTAGLLKAVQLHKEDGRFQTVPGTAPAPDVTVPGCRFNPRCGHRQPGRCDRVPPEHLIVGSDHTSKCLRVDEIALHGID